MPWPNLKLRLKDLDAYPKIDVDFRIKTIGGGAVTIISTLLMFALFLSELNDYLTPIETEELFVDTSRSHKLKIFIDIEFKKVACSYISMDAMDSSGEQHPAEEVEHNIFKKRLDANGDPMSETEKPLDLGVSKKPSESEEAQAQADRDKKLQKEKEEVKNQEASSNNTDVAVDKCGSCYGAENPRLSCCNTCDQVREAYRLKGWALKNPETIEQCKGVAIEMKKIFNEGCNIFGWFEVNRVSGSFHLAPGKSFSLNHVHVHDVQPYSSSEFNMTHKINSLSFGTSIPGKTNPIDGIEGIAVQESTMFQYYIKIVPLAYDNGTGLVFTNQFSTTRHQKVVSAMSGESGIPGVFFSYEISPIMVKYSQKSKSFGHFITSLVAIIGGIFTVSSIIDSTIYKSAKVLKKLEMGKLG